jgi:hypothetical protein
MEILLVILLLPAARRAVGVAVYGQRRPYQGFQAARPQVPRQHAPAHDSCAGPASSHPNSYVAKAQVSRKDREQPRAMVADLLIGVVGADGQVGPDEIRLLGRIYPMLGYTAEDVYSRVHAMSAGAWPGPLRQIPTESESSGSQYMAVLGA